MRICIVGAGAIGGLLGVRLANAGAAVSVLARGETLKALRQGAWSLLQDGSWVSARVQAEENPALLGPQDLVILCIKGPALAGLAPLLGPIIDQGTTILPAVNGVPWWFLLAGGGQLGPTRLASVDPGGAIEHSLPLQSVLGCVIHAAAVRAGPAQVRHIAGRRLIVGEPSGLPSERLSRVAGVLHHAGFEVEHRTDIRQAIWYKLWGNMTMNPISAVTGATCDRILHDPLLSEFVLRVMDEAAKVGAQIGCEIHETGEERNRVTRRLGAFRTSMLQDVDSGLPLEIDNLLSAPKEIATQLGTPTPNLDALIGITRLFAQVRNLYPAEPAVEQLSGGPTGRTDVGRTSWTSGPEGGAQLPWEFPGRCLDAAEANMCDEYVHRGLVSDTSVSRRSFGLIAASAASVEATAGAKGPGRVVETDVSVRTASGTCDAALFRPEGEREWPAVLLWPDILGLRPAIRDIGNRLAGEGYVVLIPNPFYRSKPAPIVEGNFDFSNPAQRDLLFRYRAALLDEAVDSDAVAYLAFLDQQRWTNSRAASGVLGYCMGGPLSFRTAAAAPNRIRAVATFHGGNALATKGADSPHLLIPRTRAAYLVRQARNDDTQQPEVKELLRAAFAVAQRPATVRVYPADHGWCIPGGQSYEPSQAERAWSELTAFYRSTLV